ncbi:MAG: CPBP family intramembrane glutamic endopeptidase [Verrucomicrobiota bacterium]
MPDQAREPQEVELNPQPRRRLLVWVLLLFAGSLVLGAVLAPYLFNALLWLGRHYPALSGLRDLEFEKVASRAVTGVALLSIIPAVILAKLTHLHSLGYKACDDWWKRVGRGLTVGAVAMAVVLLLGWSIKAYELRPQFEPNLAGKLVAYFIGALLVGVIEETLFRGALFGVLRRLMGFWGGAILSSVVYSAIHFARPEPQVGVVYGHWYSGLKLLPYMFNTVRWGGYHFFPIALTLFVLGLVLCAYYRRYGNLYFVIGFHAGLVWVMRIGSYFFNREADQFGWLFGPSEVIAKAYISLLVVLTFLAVALWPARGPPRVEGG